MKSSLSKSFQNKAVLCEETINSMLQFSHLHGMKRLKCKCIRFIKDNPVVLVDPAIMSLANENQSLWNDVRAAIKSRKRKAASVEEMAETGE